MQFPKSPPQPHPTPPPRIQTPQEPPSPPKQTPHQDSSPTSRQMPQVSSPSAPPQSPPTRNEGVSSPVPLSYPPPPNLTPTNVNRERTHPVEWSTGLCGCYSDLPNCVITCFCPCITFGEISEIVDRGSSACAINGTIYTLLVVVLGFACIYSAFYRNRMRHQFNLKGSNCGDCCTHSFCELCALCQEYRELKLRGYDMGIGWHANADRQYHEAMTTPPPHSSMRR